MFDLSELKPVETFTFNLINPQTGEPSEARVTVHGKDSKKYKSALHRLRNDKIRNPNRKPTSEQIDRNSIELLASCIESWENVFENKVELECNMENKRKLLSNGLFFDQIDEEVDNRANFLPSVEKS